MSPETIDDVLRNDLGSIDQTLGTLERTVHQIRNGPEAWENSKLDDFLEALHAWLSDVRKRVPEPPTWKLIEMMLTVAAIYE